MQPFNLSRQAEFDVWAKNKLSLYSEKRLSSLLKPIEIGTDGKLSASQLADTQQRIGEYNFVIYRVDDNAQFNIDSLHRLGQGLGLNRLDANICANEDLVSVITDSNDGTGSVSPKQRYIPYTTKALSWHTDGYYNPYHQRVQAFILHCQLPAESGGENSFIDPEMIYLMLRRQNPAFIEALCQKDVMRIPENRRGDVCLREETASSVFHISEDFSRLEMRFSQRKRHIIWRDDSVTQEALKSLSHLLASDPAWQINYRLKAGEGVISNNVLHRRGTYLDAGESKRVYLRARYYNAIPSPLN